MLEVNPVLRGSIMFTKSRFRALPFKRKNHWAGLEFLAAHIYRHDAHPIGFGAGLAGYLGKKWEDLGGNGGNDWRLKDYEKGTETDRQ